MTSFLVIAALLGVLVFALLLRPLWAHERLVALTVGVLALASAGLLYQLVGTPRALDPAIVRGPQTLAEGIAQLEAALREHPDQTEGWVLLARAYQSEGRTAQARDALDKAAKLAPNDPDILVEAAQARANADPERHFDATAVALLQSALQANPAHQRARWFLGVWQRQSGQSAQAAATWTPLLDQVDARTASSLRTDQPRPRRCRPVTAAATCRPQAFAHRRGRAGSLAGGTPARHCPHLRDRAPSRRIADSGGRAETRHR